MGNNQIKKTPPAKPQKAASNGNHPHQTTKHPQEGKSAVKGKSGANAENRKTPVDLNTAPVKSIGGRPPVVLDPASAEAFGRMKATHETMAEFFGVSHDTIARRMADPDSDFCVAYKKGFAGLRMKLSEKQIQVAMALGNVTMLIWLGKQYLGQADKQEISGGMHNTTTVDPEEYRQACRDVMKEFKRVSHG